MSAREAVFMHAVRAVLPFTIRMQWEYLPVWKEWKAVVGPETALHAWPHHVDSNGVLFIMVSDSIWMQQLSFQRHVLINKLNSRLQTGKLCEIRMFLGDVSVLRNLCGESGQMAGCLRPWSANVTEELERRADAMVEPIADEELKGLVKQLYLMSEATKRGVCS